MNKYEIVSVIKERVHMTEIFEKYGMEIKRGAVLCPFHSEKTPSLRIYNHDTQWHCFGCGAGGDVITFIQMYFNLNFTGALIRLDNDFGLSLPLRKLSKKEAEEAHKRQAEIEQKRAEKQAELEAFRLEYDLNTIHYRLLLEIKKAGNPKKPEDITDEYAYAVKKLEYLDYWFEQNPYR